MKLQSNRTTKSLWRGLSISGLYWSLWIPLVWMVHNCDAGQMFSIKAGLNMW